MAVLTIVQTADNPETIGRSEEFARKGIKARSRPDTINHERNVAPKGTRAISKREKPTPNEANTRRAKEVSAFPEADASAPIGLPSTTSSKSQLSKDTPPVAYIHPSSSTKRAWETMRISNVLCDTPKNSDLHRTKRICHHPPGADSDKSEDFNDVPPTPIYNPGVVSPQPLASSAAIILQSMANISPCEANNNALPQPHDVKSGRYSKNWKTNRPITDTQTINLFNVIMGRIDWNDESIWQAAEIKNVAGLRRTAIQKFMTGKVRDVIAKGLETNE